MKISFKLNGEKTEYRGSPMMRLIDFLREEKEATGCKEGCGEGECGACSVIVDDRLTMACITPMGKVEGRSVVTIEGISNSEEFLILRDSFERCGAVQCGFCTPGMILASYVLLRVNPTPSEDEIREGISGNLCRCTGYLAIVEAIKDASVRGGEVWKRHTIQRP